MRYIAWLRPGYAPLMERWSSVPRRPPSTFSVFPFVEGPKVRIRLPPGESQERTRIPWPPRYNSRTWRIPVSAQSAAEIGFGRQMYEQHAGGAADRASTMTAAADIVGQEQFPAAALVFLPVAGFDFERAGKHDKKLPPGGWVPVLIEGRASSTAV